MPIDPEIKATLIKIRNQSNNDMVRILSILAIPALAAALIRIPQTGWSNAMFLQISALIVVWCLFLLRDKLRPWIQTFIILILLFFLGINAMFHYGLIASGRDYFLVSTILATLFFGLKGGLPAFALSLIFFIGFGIAITHNWITFSIDFNVYNKSSSSWINLIAIWSIFVCAIGILAVRRSSALVDALTISKQQTDKIQQVAVELEEEITERKQAQNALQESEHNYRLLATYHRQLNDISIVLAEALDTEDLFKRIADFFRLLTDAIAATFSVYNQETRALKAVSLSIDPLFSSKVSSIFGPDLFEMQMPISEDVKKEMLVQSIARPKDLFELTFGVIPKEVSDSVMDTIGCRQIVALAISHADELIGTCVAYLPGGQPVVPDDALKTYIHLSELSIQRKRAEEDLWESERKARAILNLSFGFIGLLTPEGLVIETNKTSLEFIGSQLSDVAGKPFWDTPWWSHSAEMQEKLQAAVRDAADGKLVRFEATHPGLDGTVRTIDFSLKPVKDNKGNVIFLIPEGRDITERKRAEDEIRKNEERMRLFFERQVVGMAITSPEKGWLKVNEKLTQMLGYSSEELYKVTWAELTHPEDLAADVTQFNRLLNGEIDQYSMEKRFVRKDGAVVHTNLSVGCVRRYDGSTDYVLALLEDITERKRAEEEIRKNEAIMKSIFNSAPIAVIAIGPDRSLRYVVGNTNDIIGYTNEEMIGRHSRFLYFTDEEYRQAGEALYGKAVSGNITIEVRMRRKDGTEIWILLSGFPFKFKDSSDGLVVAAIDITARRAIEGRLRQSQKMEAIGQLAGGVAHDFNNMLTAILGYTDMVLFDLKPEDRNREKLTEVHKAAKRAAALTKQLLAFSRRQVLQLAPVALNQTIEDLMKMLHRLIGENIELIVVLEPELLTVNADKSQIEQVIMNLCINARDAMQDGGRLSIETGNILLDEVYCEKYDWAKPGKYVFLSITDSGYGMDAETRDKIFDPFFTTKEADKGTGLGLATVYGIVRQHNGGIQVYSEPGKGSRFTVYLPAIKHEETADLTESIENIPAAGNETILIAEDNEQVRYLAVSLLEAYGYKLLTAVDGEDALRVYKEHGTEIDLLLLDVVMPKKGGRIVYDEILSVRPDIKCLFISGYSVNAVHTNFILDQGLHLIQKPFLKDDLLRAVRRILDQA